MTRLRYGIVGAGYMAKLHSLALRNVGPLMFPRFPDIELVRMADIDHDAAIAGAKRWGWAEASDDPASVTRGGDIDVVIVITPNDSHATYGIDALAHGKHLVCEKPLANTVADALRLAEAARKSDRVSMVNFVYRAWPGVELARELIAAGELGELVHFQGHFFQDYAADPALGHSWRFDKAVAGGGAFADIGSHIMDIACTLMGPVRSISARSKRLHETRPVVGGRPYDVDDVTASLVEFRNGAHGSVHASWAATGHKTDIGFEVIGTRGSLSFNWERNNELHFFSASDPQRTGGFRRIMLGGIHPGVDPFWHAQGQGIGYAEAFTINARRMVEAVTGRDRKVRPNVEEALHIVQIVDAAYRAVDEKGWVSVPSTDAYAV